MNWAIWPPRLIEPLTDLILDPTTSPGRPLRSSFEVASLDH
jgi:hypothetical protein